MALTGLLLTAALAANEPVDAPVAPVIEVGGVFATRLSTTPDGPWGGVLLAGGARFTGFRFGALARFDFGGVLAPWAFDAGAFLSFDMATVQLTPNLTLAPYVRVEGLARIHPGSPVGGLGTLHLGLRIFGLQISAGGGFEVHHTWVVGTFETRVSLELWDFGHFIKAACSSEKPNHSNQPP